MKKRFLGGSEIPKKFTAKWRLRQLRCQGLPLKVTITRKGQEGCRFIPPFSDPSIKNYYFLGVFLPHKER